MGIIAGISAGVAAFAGSLGVGAATAGVIGSAAAFGTVGAAGGALLGGAVDAFTGKPILPGVIHGAEAGGITGLGIGAGGALGGAFGAAIGGAAGGALGSEATGSNPLTGAIGGALSGGAAGLGGAFDAAPAAGAGGTVGGTASAAGAGDLPGATSAATGSVPDLTQGVAGANPANVAQAAAGAYPVPPVPPALDSLGNPTGGYGSLADAQSAASAAQVSSAGGIVPQQSGVAGVVQSLGYGPSAGTLGSDINPALAATPDAAGPGGTYTLAQGATAPAAAPAASSSSFGSTLGSPQTVLGALGLGYSALKGNQPLPGESALMNQANQMTTQANQLTSGALNNSLPPAAQAQLSQASNAMKARIQSQYSQMGLSGSSMEAQALASADQNIAGQGYQIMQSLMSQGLSAAQASDQMLSQIMNLNQQRDTALGNSVASFAGALAHG